jgi:PAS domain S-box-containing protein
MQTPISKSNVTAENASFDSAILQHIPDIISVFRAGSLQPRFISPALNKILGYASDEFTKGTLRIDQLLAKEDRTSFLKLLNQGLLLQDNETLVHEGRWLCKNGTIKYLLSRCQVVERDDSGVAQSFMVITSDITEKKMLEAKIQQYIHDLEDFSSITSHELRHEYVKIQSIFELLAQSEPWVASLDHLLSLGEESAQRMHQSLLKINQKISHSQNQLFQHTRTKQKIPYTTIVLVDDDALTLLLNRRLVQRHYPQAAVKSFSDASLALSFLASQEKSAEVLLLLDLNMPGASGWDVLHALETWSQPMDVVILTSSIQRHDAEKAYAHSSVVGYVSKPLTTNHLKAILPVE